jgi:hypothetical protein
VGKVWDNDEKQRNRDCQTEVEDIAARANHQIIDDFSRKVGC